MTGTRLPAPRTRRAALLVAIAVVAGVCAGVLVAWRDEGSSPQDPLEARALGDLETFAGWLRRNGVRGYVGEVGWPARTRTEGEEWNHYLVPRSLRVFGFQDEPVRIVRSSQPRLERLARGGFRLVPFELRRAAQEYPQATLVYETREGRRRAAPLSADPLLAPAPNPLLARLLLFRPVPPAQRNVCLH